MPTALTSSPLVGFSQSSNMEHTIPLSWPTWKTSQSKNSLSLSTTSGMIIGTSKKRPTLRTLYINPSRTPSEVILSLVRNLYFRHHFGFLCLSVHHHHSCLHLFRRSLSWRRTKNRMDSILSVTNSLCQILSLILWCSRYLHPELAWNLNIQLGFDWYGQQSHEVLNSL